MKKYIYILFSILLQNIVISQTINLTEIDLNTYGDSFPKNLTKGTTNIYFTANDGVLGYELWSLDLTTNDVTLIKDINPGSNSGILNSEFVTVNNILFFTTNNNTLNKSQLWKSDGTESGTILIKEFNYINTYTINNLIEYNNFIYFTVDDGVNGREIWKSDGTTTGTNLFKDIFTGNQGSFPNNFTIFNNILFFEANDGINGTELWKTDGTELGTNMVINLNQNGDGIYNSGFIESNNHLYFYANDGIHGRELWKTDGTSSGTQLVKDINIGSSNSFNNKITGISLNGLLYFVAYTPFYGYELWKTDGTLQGTVLLKDISTGFEDGLPVYAEFATLNNKIYFKAATPQNGFELWTTDGTSAGTYLVKDIFPGNPTSNLTKLTSNQNYLIFSATTNNQDIHTLWKSDGTTNGTYELKNIDITNFSSSPLNFVNHNDIFYFGGGRNSENGYEIWSTDGTIQNTILINDINKLGGSLNDLVDSVDLNSNLIFIHSGHKEPFISDGSITGTHILKDINPQGSGISSGDNYRPGCFTKSGNLVYFRANDGINGSGYELWKTDGTTLGTSIVKDINPGLSYGLDEYPFFIDFNGLFCFKANDNVHGYELWITDGTENGTTLLKDINPGTNSSLDYQSNVYENHPNSLGFKCYAILNNKLYFSAFDGNDSSIWETNGSTNGTLKSIIVPQNNSTDTRRRIINNNNEKFFFTTNFNNMSYENNSLWSSDGTQANTTQLFTFNINYSKNFQKNIIFNNNLFFTGKTTNGLSLIKSDGTVIGTSILIDNFTNYDYFNNLIKCGNSIYFTVGPAAQAAKELWKSDGTTQGTIKVGEIDALSNEYYLNCNCYQDNIIFTRKFNSDKIYYVNQSTPDDTSFLNLSILNSDQFNFGEGALNFKPLNDKLYITGYKVFHGNELYSTDFNFLLNENLINSEIKRNEILIYPNPAKNFVNILTNNEIIKNVEIFNIEGQSIKTYRETNIVDIRYLNKGIYLLKITTEKNNYLRKIIIN